MDKRNKLSARCATLDRMLTEDNIAGIRGEVLMDDRIRGHCQIEELLCEVGILSDSPVVKYRIVRSHTVRYKDGDPAQIVLAS